MSKTYQYRFIGNRSDIDNALALLSAQPISKENIVSDFDITYGGKAGEVARHYIAKRYSFNDTDRAILCACSALFPTMLWEVLDARGERVKSEGAANFEGRMPVCQYWDGLDNPISWEALKQRHEAALLVAHALDRRGDRWHFLAQCIYSACSIVAIAATPEEALAGLEHVSVFDNAAKHFSIVWKAVKASLRAVPAQV